MKMYKFVLVFLIGMIIGNLGYRVYLTSRYVKEVFDVRLIQK